MASSGLEPDSIVYAISKIFKGKKNFFFRLAGIKKIDAEKKKVIANIGELGNDKDTSVIIRKLAKRKP